MVAAIEKKDAAALRKIYAESFVHTHGSGKVDGKDARIVSALAGDPVIENAPVTDLVIRVPGGWTAIATGVSPIRRWPTARPTISAGPSSTCAWARAGRSPRARPRGSARSSRER